MNSLCFTVSRLPRLQTGNLDWEFAFSLADAFLAAGGEYFETGYTYLSGRSEEVVRRALTERHPREAFRVLDKLPLDKLSAPDDCGIIFAQQCEKTGLTYFDLYLLDWLNRYTFTTTVLPTTGFRAIAGKKIVLSTELPGINVDVTIPEVAAGQKGVNFAFRTSKEFVDDTDCLSMFQKGKKSFSFGFKGQQVIASDYTIDVDLNCTYYQLRQLFRQKLEEEDVLKFYILKDGKAFDELVVDFMTVDDTENVEFTIEGKAGTNLGYYTMTLTAPAAEEGETNPDTGAESMIGVVAAMAVITLASAAAISLKK